MTPTVHVTFYCCTGAMRTCITADFAVIDAEAQVWCTVPGEVRMVLAIAVTEAAEPRPTECQLPGAVIQRRRL
jgi:hypothetical protein